jgi:hypothetical protein
MLDVDLDISREELAGYLHDRFGCCVLSLESERGARKLLTTTLSRASGGVLAVELWLDRGLDGWNTRTVSLAFVGTTLDGPQPRLRYIYRESVVTKELFVLESGLALLLCDYDPALDLLDASSAQAILKRRASRVGYARGYAEQTWVALVALRATQRLAALGLRFADGELAETLEQTLIGPDIKDDERRALIARTHALARVVCTGLGDVVTLRTVQEQRSTLARATTCLAGALRPDR